MYPLQPLPYGAPPYVPHGYSPPYVSYQINIHYAAPPSGGIYYDNSRNAPPPELDSSSNAHSHGGYYRDSNYDNNEPPYGRGYHNNERRGGDYHTDESYEGAHPDNEPGRTDNNQLMRLPAPSPPLLNQKRPMNVQEIRKEMARLQRLIDEKEAKLNRRNSKPKRGSNRDVAREYRSTNKFPVPRGKCWWYNTMPGICNVENCPHEHEIPDWEIDLWERLRNPEWAEQQRGLKAHRQAREMALTET